MSADTTRLVVVCGHAVFTGTRRADLDDEASWNLEPYQRGEVAELIAQVRRGVELVAEDSGALLVLSGGATRAAARPHTEAEGYRQVAELSAWWSHREVAARTELEPHARDSLENLLFALARFHAVTRAWPALATVVGWPFKRERFELHRAALRWPAAAFRYVAVGTPRDAAAARAGEEATLAAFRRDPYAGEPTGLGGKRLARGTLTPGGPYVAECPVLAPLLTHQGPGSFRGALPWSATPG